MKPPQRRLLEARRGVLTRRLAANNNVAPPAEEAPSEAAEKQPRRRRRRAGQARPLLLHRVCATISCCCWRSSSASRPSPRSSAPPAPAPRGRGGLLLASPDFRRRFRALHPPPLLGLFTTDRDSIISGSPTFVPARPLGRHDLAAAVRGGDFLLTSLLIVSGDWQVISSSCRLGNLLLYNHKDNSLAVLNPLTRQTERRVPAQGYLFSCVMLSSSRVMLVHHKDEGSKMKATVYSMDDTGVCLAATPWVHIPAFDHLLHGMAVHLNGSVYCVVQNWGYTVSIEDGATCLVYSDGLDVGVLMHTRDADGIQKWVLERLVSMDAELRRVLPAGQFDAQVCVLQVFAVRDGYVKKELAGCFAGKLRTSKKSLIVQACSMKGYGQLVVDNHASW
ncbi:hypothetical protein HU200_028523 [Digitaria exilis]|uniref:Uncharacterized protein n=1 Tax=Digitaria exilis TaxID=1010633 RepID=A0A835ETR1_9POAL|nr:hypothetical protein HU200_028523 [Digitaria exilis]